MLYVRGRGAGGSSSVNALGAIRGTVDDYERWAAELGCPGWGWPEMFPAFLRVEDDLDYGGDGQHGQGGPIPLSRLAVRGAAAARCRSPRVDERSRLPGVRRLPRPRRDRCAPHGAHAARRPARLDERRVSRTGAASRSNLDVRGDTLVDRVLFDGSRATGVRTAGGEEIDAREVIVERGRDPLARNPAAFRRRRGDGLPVGANLKEHAATPGFEIALKPEGRMPSIDAPMFSSMLRYSSGLADAGTNDMQMIWFGAAGPTADALAGGRLMGAVMRVFSSGEVRLKSDDPNVDPIVEFNMLSDERDLIRLRDCVRRMIDVVRAARDRGDQ